MWKCKGCGRTFPIPARISVEKKLTGKPNPWDESTRTVVEKACCPYCECIEFEEVKE